MTDTNPEHEKWKYDQNMRAAEQAHQRNFDFAMKLNESVINNSNIALRTALIINGGAAIALLSFIGSLHTNDPAAPNRDYSHLTAPLLWFAWGVALAGGAIALAYFTNYSILSSAVRKDVNYEHPYVHSNKVSKRWLIGGYLCQGLAIITGISSLVVFVVGMLQIRTAISNFL